MAAAEADGRTAVEVLTSHRVSLGVPLTLGVLIEALVEGGELDSAERDLHDRGLGGEIPPGPTSMYLLEARGLLRLAQGRAHRGLGRPDRVRPTRQPWGLVNPLASRWRSHAALALAAMGDIEAAGRMALEDLDGRVAGARRGRSASPFAVALTDDGSDQVGRLREAVDVLKESPAPLEHTRALTDLGAALRRANRRAERDPYSRRRSTSPSGAALVRSPSVPERSCGPPAADRADRRPAG